MKLEHPLLKFKKKQGSLEAGNEATTIKNFDLQLGSKLRSHKLQVKTAVSDKENDYCMPKLFRKEEELHRRKL